MPTTINGTTGVSQIQDDTVTIPKIDATGTPSNTTFLRGDGAWATAGSPPGTLELLREDTFTTSGTWTKASGFDANDTVMIFLIGGGGSGGASRTDTAGTKIMSGGGTGGRFVVIQSRYADVPSSTFTLTVGAGGAAVTRTTVGGTEGNNGGETRLEATNYYYRTQGGGFGYGDDFLGNTVSRGQSYNLRCSIANFTGPGEDSNTRNSVYVLNTEDQGFSVDFERGGGNVAQNIIVNFSTNQITSTGGCAARLNSTTNRTSWNAKNPALFPYGGAGSGTANGENATGIGGGGGGCARHNANATSGAGGNGGMVVRYYRGRVSFDQILLEIGA